MEGGREGEREMAIVFILTFRHMWTVAWLVSRQVQVNLITIIFWQL